MTTWFCRFCDQYARGVRGDVCGCGTVRGATLPTEPPALDVGNPFPCTTRAHSGINPSVVQSGDAPILRLD